MHFVAGKVGAAGGIGHQLRPLHCMHCGCTSEHALAPMWLKLCLFMPATSAATRTVRAPVALSNKDVETLESMYLDSLSLFEMAPGGVGQPVSQALLARQERARQMQSGEALGQSRCRQVDRGMEDRGVELGGRGGCDTAARQHL